MNKACRQAILSPLCFPVFLTAVTISGALGQQLERVIPREHAQERGQRAPAGQIDAAFTWRRPARYGLDLNNNGIIDLPNSFEYTHNLPSWNPQGCSCVADDCENGAPQFRVILDTSATSYPPIVPLRPEQPAPAMPASGAFEPVTDPAIEYARMRVRMRQTSWKIEGAALVPPLELPPTLHGAPYTTDVCLPEGDYSITLTAVDNYTGQSDVVRRVISVEDLFIVQLGDSYGSGEGTPERRIVSNLELVAGRQNTHANREWARTQLRDEHRRGFSFTLWADDGRHYPEVVVENNTAVVLAGVGTPVKMTARLPDFSQFSSTHKQHYRSHRSSFTASSQLALELEQSSDKSSVTYVNLAMSGARLSSGLLGPYGGVKTARFHDAADPLPGQLKQLKDIAGKRRIDALIITAGGNDAGFANAAAGLVMRDGFYRYIVNFEKIEHGVKTGDWAEVENSISFFSWIADWSDLLGGLNGIGNSYALVKADLVARQIQAPNVYLVEYPNFGMMDHPPRTLLGMTLGGGLAECEQILNSIAPNLAPGGLEANAEELRWAARNVLTPLNNAVQQAAAANGWAYIGGIRDAMEPHGACAWEPYDADDFAPGHPVAERLHEPRMRWFRREREAATIENTGPDKATGTIHPNEFGHKAVKNIMAMNIAWPVVKDHASLVVPPRRADERMEGQRPR